MRASYPLAVGSPVAWLGSNPAPAAVLDAPLQTVQVGPDASTVVLYGVLIAVVSLGVGATVGMYRAGRRDDTDTESGAGEDASRAADRSGAAGGSGDGADATGRQNVAQPDGQTAAPSRRNSTADACGPPTRIPRGPDLTVAYDALFDREPIGGGGNADVTTARLSTPDGDVTLAIKQPRLSGTLHAEQVDRLLDEAETWSKLDDHDHVVDVVDYGAEPLPWIAMEYMDGGTLSDRSGELPVPQAAWTALAVTRAVRHAHRRGVAHLDLKPDNVLFRSVAGAWDVPKVADWGLSKHLLDHSNSVEGLTPQYAAPEQFDDAFGATDDRTDVYQLGAVCYELFTGRPPFDGETASVPRSVLEAEPQPPSEFASLPPALDDVLLTALATEKADRYDDIVYFRDDLRDCYERVRSE